MSTKRLSKVLVRMLYSALILVFAFSFTSVNYTAQASQAVEVCVPLEITIWHAYGEGSAEEAALLKNVYEYERSHPCVDVLPVNIPFDLIFTEYENAVAAGGGPDMFTAPNDTLGNEVRAGLIQPLNELLKKNDLKKYSQMSVEGVTMDGQIYAVPGLVKAVALYYNKETIPVPPTTTDELLQMVLDGKRLAINPDVYHNYGFWAAFGGTLLNDEGYCIADQGGFTEAFQYLKDLKEAGAIFEWGWEWMLGAEGGVDMTITGPWVLGDLKAMVGDKLGVALMPAGPAGPSMPLVGVDGWYLNPNSPNQEAALDLALYIFGKSGLTEYVNIVGDPVARTDINVSDPLVFTFMEAGNQAIPRPQSLEFNDYWWTFGWALDAVLYADVPPAEAVSTACQWMNDN